MQKFCYIWYIYKWFNFGSGIEKLFLAKQPWSTNDVAGLTRTIGMLIEYDHSIFSTWSTTWFILTVEWATGNIYYVSCADIKQYLPLRHRLYIFQPNSWASDNFDISLLITQAAWSPPRMPALFFNWTERRYMFELSSQEIINFLHYSGLSTIYLVFVSFRLHSQETPDPAKFHSSDHSRFGNFLDPQKSGSLLLHMWPVD